MRALQASQVDVGACACCCCYLHLSALCLVERRIALPPCVHRLQLYYRSNRFHPPAKQLSLSCLAGQAAHWSDRQTVLVSAPSYHLCSASHLLPPSLQGKLRIGLAEQTVLVALAHAAVLQKDGGAKGSSEAVAGRLEQAAQIVKQVGGERVNGLPGIREQFAGHSMEIRHSAKAGQDSVNLRAFRLPSLCCRCAANDTPPNKAPLTHLPNMLGSVLASPPFVTQVYSECPSYDELIPALLAHPVEELPRRVHFKPGVPIKPMLAKPTTGGWRLLRAWCCVLC